jgi:hypothetical protein
MLSIGLLLCALSHRPYRLIARDVSAVYFVDNATLALCNDGIRLYDVRTGRITQVAKTSDPVYQIGYLGGRLAWATARTVNALGSEVSAPWSSDGDQPIGLQDIQDHLFLWGEWQGFTLSRGLLKAIDLAPPGDGSILALQPNRWGISSGLSPRWVRLRTNPITTLSSYPFPKTRSPLFAAANVAGDHWLVGTRDGCVYTVSRGARHLQKLFQRPMTSVSGISASPKAWAVASFSDRSREGAPRSAAELVVLSPSGRSIVLMRGRRFFAAVINRSADLVAAVDEWGTLDLWRLGDKEASPWRLW